MSDLLRGIGEATVKMETRIGQGVAVPGGFIVTAAHCIEWSSEGAMPTFGDTFLEWVVTKSGKRFRATPIAMDPVSDIAVLGAPDNQVFGEDAEAFDEWMEATAPVPLAPKPPPPRHSLKARVLTHYDEWIDAKITNHSFSGVNSACMAIQTAKPIKGGTSGGPVVDMRGRLLGVVSIISEGQDPPVGQLPIACLALPKWILLRMDPTFRARARAQERQIVKALLKKGRKS